MQFTFNHYNINVFDLEKSVEFYQKALGLVVLREKNAKDGSYKIVFLGDNKTDFRLELTWLRDRKEKYNLGDEEFHLAMLTDDFEKSHELHHEMGVIEYENKDMGIYFILDPDGYWIEIIPPRKDR